MTTNEEIIKESKWAFRKGFVREQYRLFDYAEILELMNLARADERKTILPKPALKNYISGCWDEGYKQGCFETKENWREAIGWILMLKEDVLNGTAREMLKDDMKELSCPDPTVSEAFPNGFPLIKDEGEKE